MPVFHILIFPSLNDCNPRPRMLLRRHSIYSVTFKLHLKFDCSVCNFSATVSNTTPLEMWEVLFTTKAGVGFVAGSAFITGWILDVILIVMVICSMPFVRRTGHFQVSDVVGKNSGRTFFYIRNQTRTLQLIKSGPVSVLD